jgi:hypothetical protein
MSAKQPLKKFCGLLLLFILNGCICLDLFAQTAGLENQNQFQIHIHQTSETIKIDGELTEEVWKTAEVASQFINWVPTDVGIPGRQTEFRTTYDDEYIYVGVVLYDTDYYVIKTLKRDKDVGQSDVWGIVIDPTNQHRNGYTFLVNAYNAQSEDVIPDGGNLELDLSWDNKWLSATARHKNF